MLTKAIRQDIQDDATEIIRLCDRLSGQLIAVDELGNISSDFDDDSMKVGDWFRKLELLAKGNF